MERWWRIIATRGDYEYGGIACYEKQADAEAAATALMTGRSEDVRRFGIEFGVRQDGDCHPFPADQTRIMSWAENLIPADQRGRR